MIERRSSSPGDNPHVARQQLFLEKGLETRAGRLVFQQELEGWISVELELARITRPLKDLNVQPARRVESYDVKAVPFQHHPQRSRIIEADVVER